MEVDEVSSADPTPTRSDPESVSQSTSSATTLTSSQGSVRVKQRKGSRSRSRSPSIDKSPSPGPKSRRRRERRAGTWERLPKSPRRRRGRSRSRSGSSSGHGRHGRHSRSKRRRATSPSIVLRSPKSRCSTVRYSPSRRERRRDTDWQWEKSRRSSNRHRRGRSRSRSNSRHRVHHRDRDTGKRSRSRSRSRSRRSTSNSSSSSSAEAEKVRKSSEDRKADSGDPPPVASDEDTPVTPVLTEEDRARRYKTKIIFVTNLSPETTKNQLEILFGYCGGRVREISLLNTTFFQPSRLKKDSEESQPSTSAFIMFSKSRSTNIAVHLIGVPFLGRPLLIFPCAELDAIPNADKAKELLSLGVNKLIKLIKGEGINKVLSEKHEQGGVKDEAKIASSSSPTGTDPQSEAAEAEKESSNQINVLLSWPSDWMSLFS